MTFLTLLVRSSAVFLPIMLTIPVSQAEFAFANKGRMEKLNPEDGTLVAYRPLICFNSGWEATFGGGIGFDKDYNYWFRVAAIHGHECSDRLVPVDLIQLRQMSMGNSHLLLDLKECRNTSKCAQNIKIDDQDGVACFTVRAIDQDVLRFERRICMGEGNHHPFGPNIGGIGEPEKITSEGPEQYDR